MDTGAYAKNAKGEEVDVLDPEAVCWCAVGYLYKLVGVSPQFSPTPIELDDLDEEATASYNDTEGRTVEDVVWALRLPKTEIEELTDE